MVFSQMSSAFVPIFPSHPRAQRLKLTTPIRAQSSFHGRKLPILARHQNHQCSLRQKSTPRMLVDPWSVSTETLDALAAQFFAASLAPYLVFLYYLNRPSVRCPPLANFGFRFLLVFVFATIPAGIYAKIHYHDILANVDWLHGSAESLLTVTNLLVVLGFRRALLKETSSRAEDAEASRGTTMSAMALPLLIPLVAGLHVGPLAFHAEPSNALSFPTWIIHVSSLLEWLAAMGLVWRYADVTNNSRWKGLTWGMIPLHTSGILACTYHLFYNASNLNVLVTLQAFLTLVGNGTMALAAYRISQGAQTTEDAAVKATGSGQSGAAATRGNSGGLIGFEDLAELVDSDVVFFGKVFLISALGSAGVKWGELLFDQPFNASLGLALVIVGMPTALNMLKWTVRSNSDERFGGLF